MHKKQKEIQVFFKLNSKISRLLALMAIPFYNEEEEEDQVLGEDGEVQDGESCESGTTSFLGQLAKELVGVYCGTSGSSRTRATRRRRNGGNKTTSTSQQSQPLPDLVCCHVQAAQRVQRVVAQPENHELLNAPAQAPRRQGRQRHPRSPPLPQLPSLLPPADIDSDPSGLSLDVKMGIDVAYRRIGQGLREIADQFENDRSQDSTRPRRTRHAAGGGSRQPPLLSTPQINIKLEFALKITIPLTLLGLSLAFVKRNCP
ncbi:uncharacterized protein LOC110862458 [Folsomia candida]|uniref:Uncharacterized protein n=1 Tax=Folsomia candida TaxID=158441 RepID=A0A226CVJ1_FOLCA|nr:uncharacterized protein LOC110862458 [Folsomia candida]OXA37415.1 hypothetical protein Fcan01_27802 [Folsomia candida]